MGITLRGAVPKCAAGNICFAYHELMQIAPYTLSFAKTLDDLPAHRKSCL